MLAIDPMGSTVRFVFYAIGLAAFVLAAIAFKIGDGKTNLLGVGLAAITVPPFWDLLADL
jgi:bacteriorhodopsin